MNTYLIEYDDGSKREVLAYSLMEARLNNQRTGHSIIFIEEVRR